MTREKYVKQMRDRHELEIAGLTRELRSLEAELPETTGKPAEELSVRIAEISAEIDRQRALLAELE